MRVQDVVKVAVIQDTAFIDLYSESGMALVSNITSDETKEKAAQYLWCRVVALKPCSFVSCPCLEIYINEDDVNAVRKEGKL